jgi:hypothetical protein
LDTLLDPVARGIGTQNRKSDTGELLMMLQSESDGDVELQRRMSCGLVELKKCETVVVDRLALALVACRQD